MKRLRTYAELFYFVCAGSAAAIAIYAFFFR